MLTRQQKLDKLRKALQQHTPEELYNELCKFPACGPSLNSFIYEDEFMTVKNDFECVLKKAKILCIGDLLPSGKRIKSIDKHAYSKLRITFENDVGYIEINKNVGVWVVNEG